MSNTIINYDELTDSRELYEAKTNPFVPIFIGILFVIILSVIIWSFFSKIEIVSKASAVVRPNEKTTTIQPAASGIIKKIYIQDGDKVKKGDKLVVLDSQDLSLQEKAYKDKIKTSKSEIEQLQLLQESISKDKNLFTTENNSSLKFKQMADEIEKIKNEGVLSDIKSEQTQNDLYASETELQNSKEKNQIDSETKNKEKQFYTDKLANSETEVNDIKLLEQSVLQGKDLFPQANSKYKADYTDYLKRLQMLESEANEAKQNYQNVQTNESLLAMKQAETDLLNYKKEYLSGITQTRKQLESEIFDINVALIQIDTKSNEISQSDANERLKQLKENYAAAMKEQLTNKDIADITISQIKTRYLDEAGLALKNEKDLLKGYQKELSVLHQSMKQRTITAPSSGFVVMQKEINTGEMLQIGENLLTVIPSSHQSALKAVIYVENKDISKIKVGNRIKYHFLSLSYKEYGEVYGSITHISKDAKIDSKTGKSYYPVEASIPTEKVVKANGKVNKIQVGMEAEAYVITDDKSIIKFFLEKINLKD